MDDPYQHNTFNDKPQPVQPVQGNTYTGGQYPGGAHPGGAYQEPAYQGGVYQDPAAYQEPVYQQGEPPREEEYDDTGAGKGIPGWFVVVIVIVALLALCCMCTVVGLAGWLLGGGDLDSVSAFVRTVTTTGVGV